MVLTDVVKVAIRYLFLALSGVLFVWLVWAQGYQKGADDIRLENANQKVHEAGDALNQFIDGAKQLTTQANQASVLLAQQINARQKADEKSTEAIREALKKTADSRVNCMFDADIMQELARARDQAAASAIGGFTGPTDRAMSSPGVPAK